MIRTWLAQCSPASGSDISLDYAQITDAAPLGEQLVAGWQAQGQRGGADESGGDADQPVPQGADHGLTVEVSF